MGKKLQERLVLLNDAEAVARLLKGKAVTTKAIVYSSTPFSVSVFQSPQSVQGSLQ